MNSAIEALSRRIVGTRGSARRYYSGVHWRRPTLPLRAIAVVLAALGQAGAQAPAKASVQAPAKAPVQAPTNAPAPAPAKAPAPPLITAWTVELPDLPAAAPAVDAEAAYVVLRGSRLAALALLDGKVAWSVPVADVGVPPETAAGLVLLAHTSEVEALDARDGTRRWHVPIDGTVAAPLLSQSGWLLVVTDRGLATMLRAATGETLWTQSLGVPTRVRPVAAGRQVYVALQDGRILGLALDTGKPAWEAKLPAEATSLNPLDDRLFVGARDRFLYCLSADEGKRKWRWRTGGSIVGSTVVVGDRVFFVSLDNVLRSLKRTDGDQQWKSALPHRPTGGPFLIGSLLFVPGVSRTLPAFRVADGKLAGSVKLGGEFPGAAVLVPGGEGRSTRLLLISGEGVAQLLEPPG
jgi:outer membrane protein assembly factor BamB